MADKVLLDQAQVRALAEEFTKVQQQADQTAASLQSKVQETAGNWQGEHKAALLEVFDEAQKEMAVLSKHCTTLNGEIIKALEIYLENEAATAAAMAQ